MVAKDKMTTEEKYKTMMKLGIIHAAKQNKFADMKKQQYNRK